MKGMGKLPVVRFVLDMAEVYFEKRVFRGAAELAFFLTLSVFPALICINALLGMVFPQAPILSDTLTRLLPDDVTAILGYYLQSISGDRPGMLAAGVTMLLVFASAAIRGLMNMMEEIFGQRGYQGLRQLGVSLLGALLLLVTVYVSAAVLFTGRWFFKLLGEALHMELSPFSWSWLRFVILFFLVLLLVLLLYRWSAPRSRSTPPLFAGAFLASGTLVAASVCFSALIGLSTRYALVYGSLTSVIILLLWLHLCGNILLLGCVFNFVRYRRKSA